MMHDFNVRLSSIENNLRGTSQGLAEMVRNHDQLDARIKNTDEAYALFSTNMTIMERER